MPSQPLNALSQHKLTQRLENVVSLGWQNPYYRSHWGTHSFDDILTLIHTGMFHHLPIIRKQQLRDNWEQLTCFEDATDVVSSSDTAGRPVDIPVLYADEQLRVLQLLSLNDLFTLDPVAWQAKKAEEAGDRWPTPDQLPALTSDPYLDATPTCSTSYRHSCSSTTLQ